MNTLELDTKLADIYVSLIQNLSVSAQLDLIAKLSASLKVTKKKQDLVERYAGCWDTMQSAEEIISDIKESRTFNRKIEDF